METCLYVRTSGLRPDFRLVIAFLWSDLHNCDTDGDSHNPASREWTELYCKNRENPAEVFDVAPVAEQPLILEVTSADPALAARVAYFLAIEADGTWADCQSGPFRDARELEDVLSEGFDLAAALERAARSVWRKATLDAPYPNLVGAT